MRKVRIVDNSLNSFEIGEECEEITIPNPNGVERLLTLRGNFPVKNSKGVVQMVDETEVEFI